MPPTDLTSEEMTRRCEDLRKEIQKRVSRRVPRNHPDHEHLPYWTVSPDQRGSVLFGSSRYTGVIRAKISDYRATRQFVSNKHGQMRDVSRIADCILGICERRSQTERIREERKAKQESAEPDAKQLREEFHLSAYGGDFRVVSSDRGLVLMVDAVGTPEQIRSLLVAAWKIGIFKPDGDESEDPALDSPTIFDRINEDDE